MKARPRRIENRVAQELTRLTGFAFERVPVIGRKGPDLTFPNPWNFAIDVKSRKEIPTGLFEAVVQPSYLVTMYMYAVALEDITSKMQPIDIYYESAIVEGYYIHMEDWATFHLAVPVLVLHRPGTPVKKSILVTNSEGLVRLLSATMPNGKEGVGGKDGG